MKSILIIRLKKVIVTLESHALLVGSIYTTLIQTNTFQCKDRGVTYE